MKKNKMDYLEEIIVGYKKTTEKCGECSFHHGFCTGREFWMKFVPEPEDLLKGYNIMSMRILII
jgi:hypothetical protein